jgi:hypothetical protein
MATLSRVIRGGRIEACTAERDVDLTEGSVRVREKGRKIVDFLIPYELIEILRADSESGQVECRPDACVIPNRRPASGSWLERSNKVISETVVEMGRRSISSVGVERNEGDGDGSGAVVGRRARGVFQSREEAARKSPR